MPAGKTTYNDKTENTSRAMVSFVPILTPLQNKNDQNQHMMQKWGKMPVQRKNRRQGLKTHPVAEKSA
jgi:hypothetical protein